VPSLAHVDVSGDWGAHTLRDSNHERPSVWASTTCSCPALALTDRMSPSRCLRSFVAVEPCEIIPIASSCTLEAATTTPLPWSGRFAGFVKTLQLYNFDTLFCTKSLIPSSKFQVRRHFPTRGAQSNPHLTPQPQPEPNKERVQQPKAYAIRDDCNVNVRQSVAWGC
jgi:hypothetical protein